MLLEVVLGSLVNGSEHCKECIPQALKADCKLLCIQDSCELISCCNNKGKNC